MKIRVEKLRMLLMAGSVIGLIDALYLTWMKITNNPHMCIQGLGDCFTVNTSKYSEIDGIPVALIGAVAYIFLFLLLIVENRSDFLKSNSDLFIFGITLSGTLFSAYLTYIELLVLRMICPFCMVSAITILILLVISIIRLIKYQPENIT
ncbi:MAG: vitamin K epoxide reductase family protein [Anaerolineaceae bacterium]|jgi:uncharacterized membrane protein